MVTSTNNSIFDYGADKKPTFTEISNSVQSPLWDNLCAYIEETYKISSLIEYSTCQGAPGWNVKYKKKSKSLCTLYPEPNSFTALVVIGSKEVIETESLLPDLHITIQELYSKARLFNNTKWLMIDVKNQQILDNVKKLIEIRMRNT